MAQSSQGVKEAGERLMCEPRTRAVGDGRQYILGASLQNAGAFIAV